MNAKVYRGFEIKRQYVKGQAPLIIPAIERCAWDMKDAKRIIDFFIREEEVKP